MPAALGFSLEVERLYAGLIYTASATRDSSAEPTLGGKLLYAGELNPGGRALLVAGNIAGAASLAATADGTAGKQAVRDGVADFLVNSLDEALRILKNEIRKGETVAVCIGAAAEAVEREMMERGVLPDVLPRVEPAPARSGEKVLWWRVGGAPAQWLPKLDTMALGCLQRDTTHDSRAARRWLRLAPRYMGRMAQGLRVLCCAPEVGEEFIDLIENGVNSGEIGVAVEMGVTNGGDTDHLQLSPRPTV